MEQEKGQETRRAPRWRIALFVCLLVVCAAWLWVLFGDLLLVRYHFRALVRSQGTCSHSYCSDYCAEHMWGIGARGDVGVKFLLRMTETGTAGEKAAALAALVRLRVREVVHHAASLIGSADVGVRFEAVCALWRFETPNSTDALRNCLRSDDLFVFHAALAHLLKRSPRDIDSLLAVALLREDPNIRARVLSSLELLLESPRSPIGEQTTRALEELVARDSDATSRDRARRILASVRRGS